MTISDLPAPSSPTLPSLQAEARNFAVHLAEYRVGSSVADSERETIDLLEAAARGAVDSLKSLINARTATAKLES